MKYEPHIHFTCFDLIWFDLRGRIRGEWGVVTLHSCFNDYFYYVYSFNYEWPTHLWDSIQFALGSYLLFTSWPYKKDRYQRRNLNNDIIESDIYLSRKGSKVNTQNQAGKTLKQRAECYIWCTASVNMSGIKWERGRKGQVMGNSGKAASVVDGCEQHQEKEQQQAESQI